MRSELTREQVLACPTLPSLPAVAVKVLELTRNEDVRLDEIATVVQNDPALSAKILRTVNSSYYNLSKPCTSISRAMAFLGLNTVKSLVLGFSLIQVAKSTEEDDDDGFDLNDLWRRCLYTAAASRRFAQIHGGCDADEAFLGGLMQDVGMLAIRAVATWEYDDVIVQTLGDHRRLTEVELESFGFHHAEIGGLLGQRWRLPENLVEAIASHHHASADQHGPLVRVVALGSEAAIAMTLPNPGAAMIQMRHHAEEWLEFDAATVNRVVSEVSEDVRELSALFDINAGAPVDLNWLLAEAEEATVMHQFTLEREADSLRKSNDELARLASTDGLTNLANRKRFDDELSTRYDQATAFRGSLGLIMADADRFKVLNDTYGHQVGDAVLIEIANRLKVAVRGIDLVCRYGGEEFVVILPGATIKDAAAIAERLRMAVCGQPFDLTGAPGAGDDPLEVSISLGAAVYDADSATVLSSRALFVKAADQALYAAKQGGRNCVRVFRAEKRTEAA